MSLLFEAFMMIAFGLSWPFNIVKSIRTKSAKGKSLFFLILVDSGYLFGIISKILAENITWVIYFYVFNFLMVLTDIVLYFINRSRDIRLVQEMAQ